MVTLQGFGLGTIIKSNTMDYLGVKTSMPKKTFKKKKQTRKSETLYAVRRKTKDYYIHQDGEGWILKNDPEGAALFNKENARLLISGIQGEDLEYIKAKHLTYVIRRL